MDGFEIELTDEEWKLIEPLPLAPSRKGRRRKLGIRGFFIASSCLGRDASGRQRKSMSLGAREFACGGCGLATNHDIKAAQSTLRRGVAVAGWKIG